MNRFVLALFVPCLALSFLALVPESCDADVVRLRTGVSIKGHPDDTVSDTDVLVIKDFLTGAERKFDWSVVDPTDRKRLWVQWGWESKSKKTVEGHRIRRIMADGSTTDILGLVIKVGTATSPYVIQTAGRELTLKTQEIQGFEPEPMDPRDIWSPEQLYQRRLDQLKDEKRGAGKSPDEMTNDDHYVLGEYADWIEMLEKAKEHFEAAASDSTFLRNTIAKQRLARVEALLRDKAALDQLREIRMKIGLKSFRKARELLASFATEHAEASEAVKRRLEKTQTGFEDARNKYFQRETRIQFMKNVKALLRAKCKEAKGDKDITYSDAFAYVRRDLLKEVFEKTAERLGQRDDLKEGDVQTFWQARPKRNWWTASFGAGTFIARPPKLEKTRRSGGGAKKKSRSSGGSSGPAMKTPPKPTRDSWWAKAKLKERMQHMLARFAEDSAQFDVSENEDLSVCPVCNGAGMQEKALSNGSMWRFVCTRCAGAKHDVRLKFR